MKVTREQLNSLLEKEVDNQLGLLTEESNENRGLLPKVMVFLDFGMPKHKKFRAYVKNYYKCVDSCMKTYQSSTIEYTSKKDAYANLDQKVSDRDIDQTEKMDSKVIQNNPELGKCITRCRVSLLKSIIELIKKEGYDICEKNKMSDTCKEWIDKNLDDMEAELEYLDQAVTKLNRVTDNKRLQKLLKKINDNLS